MAVEEMSASVQKLMNNGENAPVRFHQRHQQRLNDISVNPCISFVRSAHIPALIPMFAVSATIEFYPTRSMIYPALLAIGLVQRNPTYLN